MPQLSKVIRMAGLSLSEPRASALAQSFCSTPTELVLRIPYPVSRMGSAGVTSTFATPTARQSVCAPAGKAEHNKRAIN